MVIDITSHHTRLSLLFIDHSDLFCRWFYLTNTSYKAATCLHMNTDHLYVMQEYPMLTTFFAGEIISMKRPFLTRKWDADEDVDRKHWVRTLVALEQR